MKEVKLPVQKVTRLIELRTLLDKISQISWSFSVLNKKFPISTLTEQEADLIINEYEKLVKSTKELLPDEH